MNILLTNDDGFDAPGIRAAYQAAAKHGTVHVVAPKDERSACSHSISLYRPIAVRRVQHPQLGPIHTVDGTPADCVRLAIGPLLDVPIDLVISGINCGANTGVDLFYSGTIAAAREAAMLGIRGIAVSQAVRKDVELDWDAAAMVTAKLLERLAHEELPSCGFISVNLPAPIPDNALDQVHDVPSAQETIPLNFQRTAQHDGKQLDKEQIKDKQLDDLQFDDKQLDDMQLDDRMEFRYGKSYWERRVTEPSDFSVVRDGGISVTRIPVFGKF